MRPVRFRPLLGLALLAGLLAGAVPDRAVAVTVQAELDRTTAHVGEQVVLTLTVQGGLRSIPEPEFPSPGADFDLYSAGSSQSFSLINGHMSATRTTRMMLIPKKPGTFTLGPATVDTGKETVRSEPVTLRVLAGAAPSTAPTPPPGSATEKGSTRGSEDLFVRATVDNASPYVYQQVTYRLRLYARVNLLDNPGFSPPTTQGFWKEDLPPREPALETVDGKRYRVMEVDLAVFPTAPGKLTIGESTLECNVQAASRGSDPFGMFGGSFFDGRRIVLRSDPVTLNVKPLPPGAPAAFSGAVGDYRLDVSVDKTQVAQNEPVTLTVKVQGTGNLRTLGELKLPALPDFRVYPSQRSEETTRQGRTIGGTVTRQFVLVPLSAGEKTLPAVRLATFSPDRKAYQTLASDPITLTVTPGGASATEPGGARSDIEVVGRDIRYIETDPPAFSSAGSPWRRAGAWLLLLPLPALVYAGAWWWDRRERRLGRDTALRRRLGAAREARAALKRAAAEPAPERPARAAEALRHYLADRYNLPRAGLTPEQVEAALREDGVDPAPVLAFLERCDAARYAPGGAAAAAEDAPAEARTRVDELEKIR